MRPNRSKPLRGELPASALPRLPARKEAPRGGLNLGMMALVAFLLLVVRPGAPNSFLFLVVWPGAPSSVLVGCFWVSLILSQAAESSGVYEGFGRLVGSQQQTLSGAFSSQESTVAKVPSLQRSCSGSSFTLRTPKKDVPDPVGREHIVRKACTACSIKTDSSSIHR